MDLDVLKRASPTMNFGNGTAKMEEELIFE